MRCAALVVLGGILIAVVCAGWIAPRAYQTQYRDDISARPSRIFPLGTEIVHKSMATISLATASP